MKSILNRGQLCSHTHVYNMQHTKTLPDTLHPYIATHLIYALAHTHTHLANTHTRIHVH